MTEKEFKSDVRLDQIIKLIDSLAEGDFDVRGNPSKNGDQIDQVILQLNKMAENLSNWLVERDSSEGRLNEIMESIVSIAELDFSRKAPVTGKGDIFDALATGLNVLGEELHSSAVSKIYLDNVIASMIDMLFVVDLNGNITQVNQAVLDTLGYTEKELIDQPASVFVTDLDGNLSDFITQKIDSMPKELEGKFVSQNGDLVPVSYSVSKLSGGRGYEQYVFVAHDITEMILTQEKLKNSLSEKETLLKEIHHRVKNNLQIISSLHYLQSKQVDDQYVKNLLMDSQNRVQSMALIHEKLYQAEDLRRINFGEYLDALSGYLVQSFSGSNATAVRPIVNVDNIFLSVDIAVPCGLIITELVSNAIKHAYPQNQSGPIQISLEHLGNDRYLLKVKDEGRGFPSDFNFDELDSLGLRLVQNLVRQLNGQLNINSNNGAEFNIEFTNAEI